MALVADTSSLVSLGSAADRDPSPLERCFAAYDVLVPERVVAELRDVASHEDRHARAARAVLDHLDDAEHPSVSLDDSFPLDAGENAAVALANERDADLFLCDEFDQLGLLHASLVDTRLLTTPTLLSVLVRRDALAVDEARAALDAIAEARSWEHNAYVERARSLLEPE